MPVLDKEIIAPDTYHTPDGLVVATPRRIRHWLKEGKRMLRKGLPIPVPWEHQKDAKPEPEAVRLANQAKLNAGHVQDYFLDRDGVLWAKLDIPDPDDAEHIQKCVKFVSPEIDEDWEDGDGQTWRDIITHVALTPRPVHYRQKPFGAKAQLSSPRKGAVWLSLEQGERFRRRRLLGRLSTGGLTSMTTTATTTRDERRLSAKKRQGKGKKLSADTTTADDLKGKELAQDEKHLSEDADTDADTDADLDTGAEDDEGDDDSGEDEGGELSEGETISKICAMLKDKFHLDMPADTDPQKFCRDLYAAMHGHPGIDLVSDGGAEDEDAAADEQLSEDSDDTDEHEAEGSDTKGPEMNAREELPRAMMGHVRKAIQDAPEVQEMRAEVATLRSDKLLDTLAGYEAQGRCSKAQADTIRREVGKRRLSFANKNDHQVAILQARLDTIKDVPAHTFGDKKRQQQLSAQRHKARTDWGDDEGTKGRPSAEKQKEIQDEVLKNVGGLLR